LCSLLLRYYLLVLRCL
nr:immunoglobulin heavy chain junction region [Mus musculus]